MATPFQELSRTFSDIADRTYQRTAANEENQRRTEAMRLERAWRESMREKDRAHQIDLFNRRTEREDLLMEQERERAKVAFDQAKNRIREINRQMSEGLSTEMRGAIEAMLVENEFGGEVDKDERDIYNQRVAEVVQQEIARRNEPLHAELQMLNQEVLRLSRLGFTDGTGGEQMAAGAGGRGTARNPLDPGGDGEKRVIEEAANEGANRSIRERIGGEENYGLAGTVGGTAVDVITGLPAANRRLAGTVSGVGGNLMARGAEAAIGQRGIDFLDEYIPGQAIYDRIATGVENFQMPSARDIAAPVMPNQIPGTMGDPTRFYPRQDTPPNAPPGPIRRGL